MSAALLCSRIFGIGHDEPEHSAFAHSAVDAEAETVLLEDGFGDGEAEAQRQALTLLMASLKRPKLLLLEL